MAVKFDKQQRDQYTVTTNSGLIGMIQRVGERFAFVDARNLRPSEGRLIQVYADELQEVVDKLKELDDEDEK
jgi:preprotein translocase subunit YajC